MLPRTVELNERLESAFGEAEDLFENPNTLLALRDLTTALTVTRPALEFIAPYQTVCNYFNYFIHPLGEMQSVVQDGPTGGGTVLNQNLKDPNSSQQNNYASNDGSRPWDILEDQKPQGATDQLGRPAVPPLRPRLPAGDRRAGQRGLPERPERLPERRARPARYQRGNIEDHSNAQGLPIPSEVGTGGNGAITDNNLPGLSGGTYKSRELGIDNLADVP